MPPTTPSPWRIVLHWNAGSVTPPPNAVEWLDYHFLIYPDGRVTPTQRKPEDNIPVGGRFIKPYAPHVLNANAYSIGICMLGMSGNVTPTQHGPHPLTFKQWHAAVKLCAQLSCKYNIDPSRRTIAGHGEIAELWGIPQRGKWDPFVAFAEWKPMIGDSTKPTDIGDIFRKAVNDAITPF